MGRKSPIEPHAIQAKAVVIEEIDDLGRAMCIDQFGFRHTLFRHTTRAKGMYPAEGEKWMIDRTIAGTWTFACLLIPNPPTISGTRSANPALGNLLSTLADGGLIIDETTEGTAPGGGGVTDHGALTGLADDDHPQYAKEADLGTAAAADVGDFAPVVHDHDGDYDTLGAASSAIVAHLAATDPHGDRAYADGLIAAADALATDLAAKIPKSLVDAKGDLLVGTADDTVARLAVGSDGTVPVADTNSTSGILWARPARPALFASGGYTAVAASSSAVGQTNNRLFYLPFFVPRRMTFDRVAVNHTATTTTTGGVRLGLYATATAGGAPGALITDYGVADLTTAAGVKELTISTTLDPGIYWAAAAYQYTGSNPSCTSAGAAQIAIPLASPTTASGSYYYFQSSVSGALPSNATVSLSGYTTQAPLVWLRSV